MNMEKTGAYLASLRRGRDMTQQQAADLLGVSNKTISKWESGAGMPDIATLPALAALYGVTADDILAGETRPRGGGEVSPELGAYLAQRGKLRFRMGYSGAALLLAAWACFSYYSWSWLLLLAAPVCLWLGWSRCGDGEALRGRLLLLAPLCAVWLLGWIQGLKPWHALVQAYAARGVVVRQREWLAVMLEQEAPWLVLPLLLAAVLLVFGAALKTPLLRGKGLRAAVYGGCAALEAAEVVRLAVCREPALLYAGTAGAGADSAAELLIAQYQALEAVAAPTNAARWAVLAAGLVLCGVLALRARRKK